MMLEMLIIFIIITFILFLLIIDCLFYQDSPTAPIKNNVHIGNWRPALVLISVNLIFIVLVAFGLHKVEWFYMGNYWSGNGTYQGAIYASESYYFYAIIFYVFFLIHCILFVKAGVDAWKDALATEGEMEFNKKGRR